MFLPDDAKRLAERAGLPLPAQEKLAECAWRLDDDFLWAICAADRDGRTASANELREHFGGGAAKTRALMEWLGFRAPEGQEVADLARVGGLSTVPPEVYDTLRNLALGIERPDPATGRWEPAEIAATAPTASAARELHLRHVHDLAEAGLVPGEDELERMLGTRRIEMLLPLVPYALALLLSLSRRAQEVAHKQGKPNFERTFVKEINWRLARVYHATFGRAATTHTRMYDGERRGPAAVWAREVFATAADGSPAALSRGPDRGYRIRWSKRSSACRSANSLPWPAAWKRGTARGNTAVRPPRPPRNRPEEPGIRPEYTLPTA
jgi:hypothetical protein